MDETQNTQDQPGNQPFPDENTSTAEQKTGTSKRRSTFESLCNAMDKGAARAKIAADKAAPKVKSAAEKTFYWTAYGFSYASMFSWTLAKNLAGESSKSGFREGVAAGTEAANRWVEKLDRRSEVSEAEPCADTGPSDTAIQPNVA